MAIEVVRRTDRTLLEGEAKYWVTWVWKCVMELEMESVKLVAILAVMDWVTE